MTREVLSLGSWILNIDRIVVPKDVTLTDLVVLIDSGV